MLFEDPNARRNVTWAGIGAAICALLWGGYQVLVWVWDEPKPEYSDGLHGRAMANLIADYLVSSKQVSYPRVKVIKYLTVDYDQTFVDTYLLLSSKFSADIIYKKEGVDYWVHLRLATHAGVMLKEEKEKVGIESLPPKVQSKFFAGKTVFISRWNPFFQARR